MAQRSFRPIVFVFLMTVTASGFGIASPQDSVISVLKMILPAKTKPPAGLSENKLSWMARALMDFTENADDENAAGEAISLLRTLQERFVQVFNLAERYPCLKTDVALSALLGFKASSVVECDRSDKKNEMLRRDVSEIAGLEGFYNFEQQIAKIQDPLEREKISKIYMNSSEFHNFMISNPALVSAIREKNTGDSGVGLTGLELGYDKKNAELFGKGQRIPMIAEMKESVFPSSGENLLWIVHQGAEENAAKKMQGYKILLNLARLKFKELSAKH